MKIAFLLLCHETPRQIARRLSGQFFRHPDVKVYIHYDARRDEKKLAELVKRLPADLQYSCLQDRVHCRWGEYSLVDATHKLLNAALTDTAFQADRVFLFSGSCFPIRPVDSLVRFLAGRPEIEFIQAQDISRGRWVKDGLQEERYQFYFPFNFQSHRKLFELATAWQRERNIRRPQPEGLSIHFGSQWFCLTRATALLVDRDLRDPALHKFFSRSWIPDEFAIQSLVARHVRPARIANFTLTYYEFDEQGRPLVLENGHFAHLMEQPFFFARKVAHEALNLMNQLDEYTSSPEPQHRYFDRVGTPSLHYQKHLIRVSKTHVRKALVGSSKDTWRGAMDRNVRYYYVLHSSSREWLLHLIRACRGDLGLGLPLFDMPFDHERPELAGGRVSYLGLKPTDHHRAAYDPATFLYETVNSHPSQPAAFGVDMRQSGWIRDFVRWDPRTTLVNCDPWLSEAQRAATWLDEKPYARSPDTVRRTLLAAREWAPLPDDFVDQLQSSHEHACQFLNLRELSEELGDATLLSLRNTYFRTPSASFFPTQAQAEARLQD